jgi:hypothetical protein
MRNGRQLCLPAGADMFGSEAHSRKLDRIAMTCIGAIAR